MSDLSNMTSTELMDYANRLLYNLSSRQDFNNLSYEDQIAVTSMYRPVFTDLKEAPAQKRGKVSVTNLPAKKLTKNLGLHQFSNDFEEPEYDFKEITTLMDVESYILRGYKKRLAHMLKDGYSVIGKNIRNVDYVKSRIEEIEFLTDMSFLEFLREMGFYFLTRSTALAIKIRSNIGLGRRRTSNYTARILNPVKGFMLIDPAYAQAQFGPNYKPKAFRMYSPDDYRYQDFPREDVLYFYKNRKYGHWCGTPDLVPAAQDIATLRSLESNIELFFYQHLFPLYQYRVGTAERDAAVYPNGEREIDQVRSEIRKMPPEGLIITPYRHEIKPISEGANFTSLVEIHEIFKKLVFAALGMASIDFGEGSGATTRATANALSAQLINDIKDDIRIFTAFLRATLFNEFLFEAPFSYNPLNLMEQVSIKFPDPDQESRLHALKIVADAFQWNLLSRRESREEYLGFDPMEAEDAMDTYVEIAEKNKIKTQGETDIEVEKSKPKPVVKPAAKPKPKKKTKSAFLSEYQVSMVKEFENIATALQTDTLDEVELERQLRATFDLAKSISNSEKTRDSFLDSINEIKTLSPIIKEDTNNLPYVTEPILKVFTSIFDEGFDETSLDNTEESV